MASVHQAFFGDADHQFSLPFAMIKELQRVSGGVGIGIIFSRVADRMFSHDDILNVIRLGLIGGGTDPEEAAALVENYAPTLPYLKLYELALAILETLMFGKAAK